MAEVIREIKQQQGSNNFSSFYIGAYPQYVGALRQSNVENLEEQYVLGTNCIIKEYWSREQDPNASNNFIIDVYNIVKEFRDENILSNYYILKVKFYDIDYSIDKIRFKSPFSIPKSSKKIVRKEILSIMDADGVECKILEKTISQEITIDSTKEEPYNTIILTTENIKKEK